MWPCFLFLLPFSFVPLCVFARAISVLSLGHAEETWASPDLLFDEIFDFVAGLADQVGGDPAELLVKRLSEDYASVAADLHLSVEQLRSSLMQVLSKHIGNNTQFIANPTCFAPTLTHPPVFIPNSDVQAFTRIPSIAFSLGPNVCKTKPFLPILLFPGNTGSQLNVTWDKNTGPSGQCDRVRDSWTVLWLDLKRFLSPQCWAEALSLVFDPDLGFFAPPKGINVQPAPGLSSVEHFVYLFSRHTSLMPYIGVLTKRLRQLGYTPTMMDAFPYDWRQSTAYLVQTQGLVELFRTKVESLSKLNGHSRVVVFGHSMGGTLATHLLNHVPTSWRDKYISKFLSVSSPLYGAPDAIYSLLSGKRSPFTLGPINILRPGLFTQTIRTFSGTAELFPVPGSPIDTVPSRPMIQTPSQNYTAAELPEFFEALGEPEVASTIRATRSWLADLEPPRVPTHCIYGYNQDTPVSLVYETDDITSTNPTPIMAMGDGTVTLTSLRRCYGWALHQEQPVAEHVVEGATHGDIVTTSEALDMIQSLLKDDE